MNHDDQEPTAPFWRSRLGIGWLVLAAVAAWFLWAEHRAHLLGALPYALLLACPLMHVFMHRGHHGRHGHGEESPPANTPRGSSNARDQP